MFLLYNVEQCSSDTVCACKKREMACISNDNPNFGSKVRVLGPGWKGGGV